MYNQTIVQLNTHFEGGSTRYGTGFSVSKSCILTARHNLYLGNYRRMFTYVHLMNGTILSRNCTVIAEGGGIIPEGGDWILIDYQIDFSSSINNLNFQKE